MPTAGLHNYGEDPDQWQEWADRLKEKGINGNGAGTPLPVAVKRLLPTPAAWDGQRGADLAREEREESGGDDLPTGMVKLLPTPTERDSIGSRRSTASQGYWTSNPGTTLTDAALESTGANTRRPSAAGKTSSAGLVLNPSFVEWMMGAPDGWSDPACPLSATEFSSRPDGCLAA